jgi:hypothetical protein
MTSPVTGSLLLGLVRLLAQQAARDALEHATACPIDTFGRDQSEPEDTHEAKA